MVRARFRAMQCNAFGCSHFSLLCSVFLVCCSRFAVLGSPLAVSSPQRALPSNPRSPLLTSHFSALGVPFPASPSQSAALPAHNTHDLSKISEATQHRIPYTVYDSHARHGRGPRDARSTKRELGSDTGTYIDYASGTDLHPTNAPARPHPARCSRAAGPRIARRIPYTPSVQRQ